MGEVNECDTVQAQEMLSSVFGAEYARSETNVLAVARFMATHRQAAEKATRERDAGIVKAVTQANVQARTDRADDKLAFEFQGLGDVIATAIRRQNDD